LPSREVLLAKVLCGGIVVSLMLTIMGAMLTALEMRAGRLTSESFFALPFSFKFLIVSISLFVFFILLLFTVFLWKVGYKLVLKYVFGVKEEAG